MASPGPLSGSSPPTPRPLNLTIRFTTAIPDLLLDIPNPSSTTVIALKHLVRASLPPSSSTRRLRPIHSGKLLRDDSLLPSVLKIPSPPPRAPIDPKGKGKEPEEPIQRIYIQCAIGDVLSPEELAAEAAAAAASETNAALNEKDNQENGGSGGQQETTTTPAPRGFDRLLSGGFTPAEVNQLRLQFLSIQSNIHTPDTMPSPSTLRRMEDAWIDNNGAGTGGNSTGEEGGFDFGDDGLAGGALDDLLYGNVMGFLWPLGAISWLIMGGGVWSRRRQIAVFTGFMLSIVFGMLKVVS